MRLVIAAVLLLAGCEFNVPPVNGEPCTASNGSCVCLMPQGVCVECTVDDTRNCAAATPMCGDDNRCRECRSNDECGDGACLEDGTCASPDVVLHASPTGSGSPGCGTTPGQPCSITQALIEVGGARSIIRLAPGTYNVMNPDGLDVAKPATLAALGATITRTGGAGPLVTVRSTSQKVKLIGGTLRGLSASDGIKCDNSVLEVHRSLIESLSESAIESTSCALTVKRSTLRNNLLGGINMLNLARVATIMNNFVYRNGTLVSPVGGMVLKLAAGSRVELNTVVSNTANTNGGSTGGIACDLNGYDVPRNLVYRNQGGLGGQVQGIGTCTFLGSYVMPAGSINEDVVGFERPNDDSNPSFRLTASSSAINKVECRDEIDFEGDARPQPRGGLCDFGADEFRAGQ